MYFWLRDRSFILRSLLLCFFGGFLLFRFFENFLAFDRAMGSVGGSSTMRVVFERSKDSSHLALNPFAESSVGSAKKDYISVPNV